MEHKRRIISKNNLDRCDGNLYNWVTKAGKIQEKTKNIH